MKTIDRLGLGQRGLYFGLGLAVGLGFAARGAAASTIKTACPGPTVTRQPAALARPAHPAALLAKDQHRWWLTLERALVVTQVHGTYAGTAHAHGKYVVVFLTVQNTGKVPQDLGIDENFAVTDAQGRQFGLASATALSAAEEQYKRDNSFTDVQPTFSAHVSFVFDVASDARGLTLINAPSFDDHTQKLFGLGL